MGIQDGYGEQIDLESFLAERDSLLRWKADNDPDLAQEGRIAIWRTLEKKPDATRSYVDQAASWRIAAVRSGKPPTGWVQTEGKPARDPLTPGDRKASTYADMSPFDSLLHSSDLESIELAYHYGEIAKAISELPPKQREYVVLRFWRGMEPADIAARLQDRELWRVWKNAKANLAEKLHHLASAT